MDKPFESDSEDIFDEEGEANANSNQEENQKDNENVKVLSLEKLNALAGRSGEQAFKSVEDFEKHYGNLKSFVGKAGKKEEKPVKKETSSEVEELRARLDAIEAEKKQSEFLSQNPEAKANLDLLEAYAEKSGKSLAEAWEEKKDVFSRAEEVADIKSTNRIAPIRPKDTSQLETLARQGNYEAQAELVKLRLHGNE